MERPDPQLGTHDEILGGRILAWIIDAFLIGLITLALRATLWDLWDWFGFVGGWGLLSFAYFIYFEAEYGQTPGKKVMDIVAVKEDGGDCDWPTSIVRNVFRVIDGFAFYLLGMIFILLTDENQRLGDIVANTVVVEVARKEDDALAVDTHPATDVTEDAATLEGELTELGADLEEAEVWFEWGEEGTDLSNETPVQTVTDTGPFTKDLAELEQGTEYEFRAHAQADDGEVIAEGEIEIFITAMLEPSGLVIEDVYQETGDRYVDIRKEGDKTVDLSKATITDGAGNRFQVGEGFTIEPDETKTFHVDDTFARDPDSTLTLTTQDGTEYTIKWNGATDRKRSGT